MSSDVTPFDEDYFSAIHAASYASARVIVPRVLGLTGASSVVDVGCGSGAWSQACRDLGVPEVVGVDGTYLPADRRRHATTFLERNLAEPLRLDRRFGLAICVEVAEHVPPDRAPGLVADLIAAAPVVVFSAAVPGQGGEGHVNEQWPEFWVALFEAEGWSCRDAIRPWVRTNENVAWWYRQNLFLAVAPAVEQAYTSFPRLTASRPEHPVDYLVRPPGDVITAPPPPIPAAPDLQAPEASWPTDDEAAGATEAEAWGEAEGEAGGKEDVTDGILPPPPDLEPDPEPVPAASARPVLAAADAGPEDEPLFPEPPGWAAVRSLADRARRRLGR